MLAVVLVLLLCCKAIAVPLADLYQFGSDVGDTELPRDDDNSSPPIELPHPLTVFGTSYNVTFVNINGNISPGQPLPTLNYEGAVPAICPYKSDVDTRPENGGAVWYRVTNDTDLLERAHTDIMRVYPSVSVPDYLLIATWDHVTAFDTQTLQTNTFQAVVAVSGNQTYAIFLYADGLIRWSRRSGKVLAGYSGTNTSFDIGEMTDILRITFTTNVECPGMWVFRLDKEDLVLPETSSDKCDTIQDQSHCDSFMLQPSYECVHRYGSCVPYQPIPFCDEFYEPDLDYVYIPSNRSDGSLSELIKHITDYGDLLLIRLKSCREIAIRVLCHYYLPPCGRGKQFQPPTAVCSEQCRAISQQCPEEWDGVVQQFDIYSAVIEETQLQLIDCDNPGEHLAPLSHCCSDLGLNTSYPTIDKGQESGGSVELAVSTTVTVLVISGIIAGVILVLLSVKCYQKRRIKTKIGRKSDDSENVAPIIEVSKESSVPVVLSDLVQGMSLDNLLVHESDITLQRIIGEGEFGVVYRAILKGKKDCSELVAVKTLKGLFSSCDLKHLAEESQIMARFDHPNVMKLLGVSISKSRTLLVIMPYMAQGSLLTFLRKNRDELTFDVKETLQLQTQIGNGSTKLLSMCLQVAKGMKYLSSQRFVHRDLAARNCMIDMNGVIKVADFGLSEDIYARKYFKQAHGQEDGEAPVKLPVKWMALESLNDGVFSEKTDVWSFGVTCWEVFSLGKNPYPGVNPFSLIRYLERGERLDKPLNEACSQEIYDMMTQCWVKESWKRPSFSQLVNHISTSLEEMAGYLDITRSSFSPD